jgi:hypothetical protein
VCHHLLIQSTNRTKDESIYLYIYKDVNVGEAIKREMNGVVYDRAQKEVEEEEERLTKLNEARRRSIIYEERSDKQNRIKTGRNYTVN